MDKKALREKYKILRSTLTSTSINAKSIAIANALLKLPIWTYNYYHTYLPIATQKEVNTEYLLSILQGKDKHIVISKSDFKTTKLSHFLLTDATVLITNAYGIPEPTNGIPIAPKQLDVVFVPLLAYDTNGNRVGYGKGFYDVFLNDCREDCIKIGLSFFDPEPIVEGLSEQDVSLDYVVTPERVFEFK